jgi:hypothetical protein
MGIAFSMNGREEGCVYIIGGKARRKETTRKTKIRWVGTIKMDLGEIGWGDVDWIDLAQDKEHSNELLSC